MTASFPPFRLSRSLRHPIKLLLAVLLASVAASAHADIAVLVGEPFGSFGAKMPLGHVAIYLDRVCADGPLKLKTCSPGEQPGVVLARYHAIGKYDWLAVPVMEFLYATDRMEDVPQYATPEIIWALREKYRQQFLRSVVPDGTQGREAGDGRSFGAGLAEWWESAGMAYNRRIWGYQAATSPAQDEKLIEAMNTSKNRHLYHLLKTNCADFGAQLVNLYFPGAVHNDRIADFGFMTPKQVARSLTRYAATRPAMHLRIWQIPQVPGNLRRSRPAWGGAESGIKTKRYLLPLLVIGPEVPAALAVLYLWHGRWKLGEGAGPMPEFTPELAWNSPRAPGAKAASNTYQSNASKSDESSGSSTKMASNAPNQAGSSGIGRSANTSQ